MEFSNMPQLKPQEHHQIFGQIYNGASGALYLQLKIKLSPFEVGDMELISLSVQSSTAWIITTTILVVGICCTFFKRDGRLPPGPFSWPVVGSLFSLQLPLYRHFAELAKRYGPVIYLKIGMVPYVVVNNPEMAKEVLKVHDLEFAHKPDTHYNRHFSFGYNDIAVSPYGERWKKLRRATSIHLFSPAQLNATASFRKSEMEATVRSILQLCKDGYLLNMRTVFGEFISNVMCLILFGKKIDPHSGANSVMQLVEKLSPEVGRSLDIGELIPALQWLDLHGVEHRMKHELMPQLKSLLSELIEEHRQRKAQLQVTALNREVMYIDFIDAVISEDALSDACIMGVVTDLITPLDATKLTLEWAMAEVMNNPQVMLKAQAEIDKVVGKTRLVQESDLPMLPYIQAIVKEVLRLRPQAPLNAAHFNPNAATIAGYKIPAKCKVLVNIWAIGRDPAYWTEPEEFKPERFLESDVNVTGQHFELIPFSAGRRICAGYPLLLRTFPLVLATLLQAFDWSLPPGQSNINMNAEKGSVNKLSSELIAAASPRLDESVYASM